jgi:glycosyltransferase involved in cell wall biosynthesis
LNFAKGVPSLIRAYNKLAPEGANLKLAFAGTGTGSQCDSIVNMAHDSRLPIDLKGIVPQQELAQLFRQSRLFVFPSFYEGLPLVLMEALACGLRIVTTDLPGVRDFFGPLINGRGLVEYVALPPLKTIDEPVEEALPDFETRFAAALKKQVAAIQSGDDGWDDAIEKQVRTMTWQAVFHKIERLFTH